MKKFLVRSTLAFLCCLATQAQVSPPVIPSGKLAVFKAGTPDNRFNMVTARVAPCYVQVFDPNTLNQSSPLLSVAMSTNVSVPGSVWINHHAGSEGAGISRSVDRQFLVLEGYTGNILSPTAAKPSTDFTVTRGIVTLNAFTNALSVYSDLANWFGIPAGSASGTQDNPTGIASTDGTNFWGTGNFAGSSAELDGTLYYNAAGGISSGPYEVQNYLQAAAQARIIGGTLYVVVKGGGVVNFIDPASGNVVPRPYDPAAPNPVQHPTFTNQFLNWGATYKNIANFDMNPQGTIAYGADQTFGIIKFTNNAGVWTQAPYYFSSTNLGTLAQSAGNQGCFGICVDFSGTNPVIYASTMENGYPTVNTAQGHQNQNRLVQIVDSGTNPGTNLVAKTLAIAATTNEFFGGLDFTPDLAPLVTQNPAGYSTINGGTATFSAAFQSVYPLTYQWLQNGTNLAGATLPTLSLSTLDTTSDSYTYQCVATNTYGSATSASALLTVNASPVLPAITSAPAAVTNYVGNPVIFGSPAISGTQPFLAYQWFNQSRQPLVDDGVKYSGSASPSLTISNLVTADAGNYFLAVYNSAGSSTTNLVDILTVKYHLATINAGQPQSVTTFLGVPTTLTANQTGGTEPLTYQWYKGASILSDGSEYTGTDNPALAISATTTSDTANNYFLVISNPGGNVTSTLATVTVLAPPPLSAVSYSNQLYFQSFDSLPNPGGVSVNSINNPLDKGTINGVAYSLANPFDFNYPVIINSYVGGLGLSKMQGWYGAADTTANAQFSGNDGITRFGAQNGDQSTGGVIDYGLNDVNGGIQGTNRALGLQTTSTTGGTSFALRLTNASSNTLNYVDVSFIGELWRNNSGPRTMSFGYVVDPTGNSFVLDTQSISNCTQVPSLFFSFPTNNVVLAMDGTQSSNQVVLAEHNLALSTPWTPGASLWLIWSLNFYGAGAGQGLAIDNLFVSGSPSLSSAPVATTSAASKVTTNSVQFNGTVNPNNGPTAYWFDYGSTAAYGNSTATNLVASISGSGTVLAALAGLPQGTGYHYRLVATNSAGLSFGNDFSFTTLAAPVVTTLAATNLTVNSATLAGSVNPGGNAATYYFKYGTNTSYGSFTTTNSLVSGTSAVSVVGQLNGLLIGKTYHYQLVATTSVGTVPGVDKSFTLPTVTPPGLSGTLTTGGAFVIQFTNAPGASFSVVGTNVLSAPKSTWPVVGQAVESPAGSGNYQFTVPSPGNTMFYLLRQP